MAGDYHESELSPEAREIHRALASVIEELEAVDWYHQRADATADEALRAIVLHNRNEEIEHASMALEWLRRMMPEFDERLRTYLFTTAPITEIELAAEKAETAGTATLAANAGEGRLGGRGMISKMSTPGGTPMAPLDNSSAGNSSENHGGTPSGPSTSSFNIGKFKKGS